MRESLLEMKLYVLDYGWRGSFSVMALSRQEAWRAMVEKFPFIETEDRYPLSLDDLQVAELGEVVYCMVDQ
jgi:hypothetical protein